MKRSVFISTTVLTISMLFLVASSAFGAAVSYTYDDAGRLVSASYGPGKAISYAYDLNGNLLERAVSADASLADAIVILKMMAGMETADPVYVEGDINNDHRIGLEEVGYILQRIAGTRN